MRPALCLLGCALPLLAACPSRQVLVLENRLLNRENTELQRRLEDEATSRATEDFDPEPDLESAHRYLQRSGYVHDWAPDSGFVYLKYAGRNTEFAVAVRHFESRDVLLLTTQEYASLDLASDAQGAVLLLTTLATLNYDLLLGKFQLNSETGEVLLSTELQTADGLSYDTFMRALETLLQVADQHHPEIVLAASGRGI